MGRRRDLGDSAARDSPGLRLCAVCRDELTGAPLLEPETIPPDIRAYRIAPVGNYALTFDWSDSHSTGIFPWEMLRALADRSESESR